MPHRPTRHKFRPPWRASVLTLFPEMFPGPLGLSLAGQALDAGLWALSTHQIRDHGIGRHRAVDDNPAGGGAGMVMRADVIAAAVDAARAEAATAGEDLPLIYFSPRGEQFTQKMAHELASGPGVMLLAGRFEGIDQRVIEGRGMREVSIGDYILSGGELAALVLLDACVRLLPGVVGSAESLAHESFETGMLEYPLYTRPREWEGRTIPDVLLSGDHQRIANWQTEQAHKITTLRRPDLLQKRSTTKR
ncbi:MAG: tRNA (guanosine(37)-N1)-methyltransferase TrmD [Hyphomicrobiaceae bacterium]|nr:tRNA (guanosine(37)-N1)-methyltransferase TrmD [Hyphomicrobiaceae bacterium]MCC0009308.1 tRNA (guanosine(37)-N1)-methyltransferase TrmD [Hyphomicrobiaceae bacterium]